MATFTSTRAGNWSAIASWGGSGPPGAGDLAIVAVVQSAVSAAANNGSSLVRLTVGSTSNWTTGQYACVSGVTGTTEANGLWAVTVVDGTHLDLQSSAFANAYVSGGNANCVVAVDANTTVGATTSVGIGVTINGTSANQFGCLIVLSGVSLTLRGFDLTTHCMMQINQYGQFLPQPGSTVLGDVAANFGSKIINKGRFRALGTGGSPITFSIPPATASTLWGTAAQVVAESTGHSAIPWTKFLFDATASIGIQKLTHDWIANAARTGPGSLGNGTPTFAGQSGDTTIFTGTERSTIAGIVSSGDYYVDYDRGIVYFKVDYSKTITFTVSYYYLVDTTAWRGWGIDITTGLAGNSFECDHCAFSYLGDQTSGGNPALNFAGLTGGQSDASTLLQFTNCTVSDCYHLTNFKNCNGDATHYIQFTGNTFNNCRGDTSMSWVIGFTHFAGGSPWGSSYIQFNSNTLNQRNHFVTASELSGRLSNHQSLQFNSNTGSAGGLLLNNWPGGSSGITFPDGQINSNQIVFLATATPLLYPLSQFCGTSGHPAIVKGNSFSGMIALLVAPYLTIDSNIFQQSYMNIGSIQVQDTWCPGLTITNNLFYGAGTASASIYKTTQSAILLGWNFRTHYDGVIVANNQCFNYSYGFMQVNGSFDGGGMYDVTTGLVIVNNSVYGSAADLISSGYSNHAFAKYRLGTTNKSPVAVKALDYNGVYNCGAPYLIDPNAVTSPSATVVRNGTFVMSGGAYNYASRNVTGVFLSQPGYSTAQGSSRSLVYTITSAGVNETLAWGGGTAVQLIQSHGTATAGTNATVNGVVGMYNGTLSDTTLTQWSTALNSASNPQGCWIKITGGTGSGQIRMITNCNSTSQVTVVPAWTTVPDATSTYSIYQVEVTLFEANASGLIGGAIPTNTGAGYTSAPTVTISGTGSSAALTAVLGGQLGQQVVSYTLTNAGTGYTGTPTFSLSGGGGSNATGIITMPGVQAGIDVRLLPGTSQTDTGITLTFNDVVSDGLVSSASLPASVQTLATSIDAATAKFSSAAPLKNAGTANDAPALDYFGTARPQGTAFDIGFFELLASGAALIRRIITGGD